MAASQKLEVPELTGVEPARPESLHFVTASRDADSVLAALLAAGITVVGLKERAPRLEDVFLRRTEGKIL